MTNDFTERVVLITGAARGLGRATAARFIELGAQVAVNVRTPERAETLARELGGNSWPAPGDIRKSQTVRALIAGIVERFGRLDVLINNAAIASSTRLEQLTEDEWRATIDTNLTAAFFCIQAVIPSMKKQSYGRIINVSSLAERSVSTLAGAHYTASNEGVCGLTRAARTRLLNAEERCATAEAVRAAHHACRGNQRACEVRLNVHCRPAAAATVRRDQLRRAGYK